MISGIFVARYQYVFRNVRRHLLNHNPYSLGLLLAPDG